MSSSPVRTIRPDGGAATIPTSVQVFYHAMPAFVFSNLIFVEYFALSVHYT
jgi:hypothetical protein